MSNILKYLLLLTILLCSISCGEYEALEVKKDAERIADSLFRVNRPSLIKDNDSICAERQKVLYQIYYDSLKLVEGEKIKRLLSK